VVACNINYTQMMWAKLDNLAFRAISKPKVWYCLVETGESRTPRQETLIEKRLKGNHAYNTTYTQWLKQEPHNKTNGACVIFENRARFSSLSELA